MDLKYLLLTALIFIYCLLVTGSLFNTRIVYLEWLVTMLPYLWGVSIILLVLVIYFWIGQGFIGLLIPSLILLLLTSMVLSTRIFNTPLVSEVKGAGAQSLRLAFFNKLYSNTKYEAIDQAVKQAKPDILGIAEIREADLGSIKELEYFPYSHKMPARDGAMLAVYSKHPLELDLKAPKLSHVIPLIADIKGESYHLFVIHPKPPINNEWMKDRNTELESLVSYISLLDPQIVLLMGDFNLSPWSKTFTNLNNSLVGLKKTGTNPLSSTWHSGVLGTQIDHIFVPTSAAVLDFEVIGVEGSDHKMIVAQISL
jgi:endonuclease/exonuclease/phosphatase (EEP) superfamily protein YafD